MKVWVVTSGEYGETHSTTLYVSRESAAKQVADWVVWYRNDAVIEWSDEPEVESFGAKTPHHRRWVQADAEEVAP